MLVEMWFVMGVNVIDASQPPNLVAKTRLISPQDRF